MQRESESEENVSWNEIGEVLDMEMSTVEDIRADLARNDKGNTCQTINNCMLVFQRDPLLKGAIRKNELSGKIDIVGNLGWQRTSSSLTDTDVYQIHWYLEKNYGLKNDRNINKAMNIVASENKYHPIRECLEKIKWDGQPRIDNLLPRYLGADHDDYTVEIMRLLMLAAIRRVYEPGCKFEIMVCLVGGQGAGKSTFFRFLAINDEWFSDDLKRMDDDNVYRKMQGHWIIEMSPMPRALKILSLLSAGKRKPIKFPTKHTRRTDQDNVYLLVLPTIWTFFLLIVQGIGDLPRCWYIRNGWKSTFLRMKKNQGNTYVRRGRKRWNYIGTVLMS